MHGAVGERADGGDTVMSGEWRVTRTTLAKICVGRTAVRPSKNETMKRNIVFFTVVLIVVLMFNACDTVPISGRKQLRLISERDMIGMSLQAYDDFLDTSQVLPDTHKDVIVVRRDRKSVV